MSQKIDYTYRAIKRQLNAFGCIRYEIGLYDHVEDKMLPRAFTERQIIHSIAWLKKMNTDGRSVFIRPEGSQGFIFFDDLSRSSIDELTLAGLEPAIVIESSPANYHGWIRVSLEPIESAIATLIAKKIAIDFGGDKDSADWRHFGRLAGFTNQKNKHIQKNGQKPFVKIISARSKLCTRASFLLDEAKNEQLKINTTKQKLIVRTVKNGLDNPDNQYQKLFKTKDYSYFYKDNIGTLDHSRVDFSIVIDMLKLGYEDSAIQAALHNNSEAAHARKSHAEQYVNITLHNAKKKFKG